MKTLYIQKLTPDRENEVLPEIKKQFDVEKFFDTSGKIIVGKKTEFKIDPSITDRSTFLNSSRMKKNTLSLSSAKVDPQQGKNSTYEALDRKGIKKFFDSIKPKHVYCRSKPKIKIIKTEGDMPYNIRDSLDTQYNTLLKKTKNENEFNSISRYILSKTTKKHKEDLLMNSTTNFQIKNQILNSYEENIARKLYHNCKANYKISGESNTLDWLVSLRRPNNFQGERKILVNLASDKHPFWTIIKEKRRTCSEFLATENPSSNSRRNIKILEGQNANYGHYGDLAIKGRRVFDIEYNNALKSGKVFIKRDFLKNWGKEGNPEENEDEMLSSNYPFERFNMESTVTNTYLGTKIN